DGRWLAANSSDNTVQIWELPRRTAAFQGKGWAIFSPDGERLIVSEADEVTHVLKWPLLAPGGATRISDPYCVSPDGRILVTGDDEGLVRLWDLTRGEEFAKLEGHTGKISDAAFSPDGRILATSSNDGTRLWNVTRMLDDYLRFHKVAEHQAVQLLEGHQGSVTSVTFSPDSRRLATGGADATVSLWDINSHLELMILRGHRR